MNDKNKKTKENEKESWYLFKEQTQIKTYSDILDIPKNNNDSQISNLNIDIEENKKTKLY